MQVQHNQRREFGVAIVGAGVAGLACARALTEAGVRCRVFEKSRGVGGRMATRRAGEVQFDHGAKHFKADGEALRNVVTEWTASGAAAQWRPRGAGGGDVLPPGRFVGVPGMNGIARRLAEGVEVSNSVRVATIAPSEGGWHLVGESGEVVAAADTVLVTAPAPQAALLLAAEPHLAAAAGSVAFDPCWALLVAFAEPLEAGFDAHRGDVGGLTWAAREVSKTGRPASEAWVAHASPAWTWEHLEDASERVAEELLREFAGLLGRALPPAIHLGAHRWRYARPRTALGVPCLWEPARRLGAAGDWCLGRGVEAAFDSGRALAAAVLGTGG